jgi:HSP20 family protein
MTLVKFNNHLGQKSFSSLVDEFFQELPGNLSKDWNAGFPPVNIYETKEAYHLELNAPGRNKEDFSVNVDNGLLTIGFEKKEENKTEDFKTVRKEFSYKSFTRSFNLDDRIDGAAIQAKYENGVLKLYLPKKEQAKEGAKKIQIS